jgi:nitroreductase
MISTPEQQAVDAAITSRRSIRAYLPQAVARDDIAQILRVAGRAPSGTNTQPWKVYVLEGERKRELSAAILAIHNDPEQAKLHTEEYAYYPREWVSPFIERRRKVGWDLYALLGLTRDNKAGMAAQHGRNYDFFGAPVGLIFTIDRVMQQGSWLDYGMFLQSVMVAARARGLDTCPQAAFTQYHRVISSMLDLPDNETVVCGMSLGYADTTKIENSLITERMAVEEFVKFVV